MADGRAELAPPSGNKLVQESKTVLQIPRLARRAPTLLRAASLGDQRAVMFVPGLKANDASNAPLRAYLRRQGYRPFGWGLGVNRGDVDTVLPSVESRVEALAADAGGQIALVGWSLGGLLAREVARDRPDLVARVVTYGTPVVGGPLYTSVTGVWSMPERRAMAARVADRNRTPIEVPVTAMWSKNDGIVAWRACIDDFSPYAENIEITSTHVGMGIDPDVWEIVADRCAR